jgi:hypothetical protein
MDMITEQKLAYHNNLVRVLDLGVTQKFINGHEFIMELTGAQRKKLLIEIDRVAMTLSNNYYVCKNRMLLKPEHLRVDNP